MEQLAAVAPAETASGEEGGDGEDVGEKNFRFQIVDFRLKGRSGAASHECPCQPVLVKHRVCDYTSSMSAAEVIEQIKALPLEEKAHVFAFVHECEGEVLKNGGTDQSAREAGEWVVKNYGELLRKLAQ